MCDDYCDEWNKELKTTWECGEEMYVCPRCKRLVPMDMNFCGYCGVYLNKEKCCENCSQAERRKENRVARISWDQFRKHDKKGDLKEWLNNEVIACMPLSEPYSERRTDGAD